MKTIDFYIGLMKNGLTSQAFLSREDVRHGWDEIVKVSLDPETFKQIYEDKEIHPRHFADNIVNNLMGKKK